MLLADYSKRLLLPESQFKDFKPPAPFIPESPSHHEQWIQACKTGAPTGANFAYSGALTEAVLLGNLAHLVGQPLDWDAANLRVTNVPAANELLRRDYRKGWSL